MIASEIGKVKFPVEEQELIDRGYTELTTRELGRMRREEWDRLSALPTFDRDDYMSPDRDYYKALSREICNRSNGPRQMQTPDSSDLDQTYLYPGEPAPPGFKWMLVADTDPGIVAYRVHGPNDVEFIYE